MESIKAASICMNSTPNRKLNIDSAFRLMETAVNKGADWIVLPELFSFIGPHADHETMGEIVNGELWQNLANFARTHQIILFPGSLPIKPEPDKKLLSKKVRNTLPVFGRQGELLASYDKCHLFELKNESGTITHSEHEGFLPGNTSVTIEVDGFHVGLSICYDLRFSRFYHKMAAHKPLDVVMMPAAFTLKTGIAHWEVLLRARAIEHQCYVLAANQYGVHYSHKESFGHSMIIDPWGACLANTGASEGIAYANLKPSRLQEVRNMLPVLGNSRPEIY